MFLLKISQILAQHSPSNIFMTFFIQQSRISICLFSITYERFSLIFFLDSINWAKKIRGAWVALKLLSLKQPLICLLNKLACPIWHSRKWWTIYSKLTKIDILRIQFTLISLRDFLKQLKIVWSSEWAWQQNVQRGMPFQNLNK